MQKIKDLSIDDLRNIIEVIIDSIKDEEKSMCDFATDVVVVLKDYGLIE